jgi:protein ImuB
VDVLERLGLVTLGRFARLERTDVLARFGHCGMLAHALARGTESSRVSLEDLPADVGVSACFDPPAESVDQVGFMAKTLATELHSGLESRGLGCTRVLVVAETELGERVERYWRDEGTLDAAGVAQRARWQLEGWLSRGHTVNRQRGGVLRLELFADQVVPANGRQLGLWGGDTGAPERAERGIARLVAMLGPDAVVVPRSHGGRSPRERYRMVPVGSTELGTTELGDPAGPEGVGESVTVGPGAIDAPWPGSLPKPAPVLVWPDPQLVELCDSRGHMVGVNGRGVLSGVPVSAVVAGGPRWDIRSWAGPWCIDERWWDPTGHRRRARLQVLVDSGAHLLTLESGQWRLEATYD